MPTKTAAAGRYESHGEDFIHFLDSTGALESYIDSDGVIYGSDCIVNGISLQALKQTVDGIVISGLPSDIDVGTF